MIGKCANPECPTEFKYFRDGKIFEFPSTALKNSTNPKSLHRKMYWLCAECSRRYTLAIENGHVIPRQKTA